MSTFAEAFRQWPAFPKGLHVLVVDRNAQFLRDITYKLESYQFYVTSFSCGEEACAALASYTRTFHVALVEATENDGLDSCKILAFSKDIPTILMSAMENMSLMVKLIALGAVEFLVKPLSEDKLRNIWQHVIRKALDSSRDTLRPGYLEPGKPTTSAPAVEDEDHQACSKLDIDNSEPNCVKVERHDGVEACSSSRLLVACDRLAAPSTPQLEQGGRTAFQESTLDESPRSHDSAEICNYKESNIPLHTSATSFSTSSVDVKDVAEALPPCSKEARKEEKAQAQIFCCPNPMLKSALHDAPANALQMHEDKVLIAGNGSADEGLVKKAAQLDVKGMAEACEMSSTDDYEPREARSSSASQLVLMKDTAYCPNADSTCQSETRDNGDAEDEIKRSPDNHDKGGKDKKISKKKTKVDWTADLHRRFVQAVEYLGVEQAIPSRILEVMKVEGLTRHNVASHLQKYRSHKKHIQAREVEASHWQQSKLNCGRPWNNAGQSVNQLWIQPRPPLIGPPLHVWGHPKVDSPVSMHFMPQYITAGAATWPAFEIPSWKAAVDESWAPRWPSMAPCYGSHPGFFTAPGYPPREGLPAWRSFLEDAENRSPDEKFGSEYGCQETYPPKDLLDAAISEALSNPWMPLPLGLKPPLMETVMAELQRQGITTLSSSS